MPDLVKIVKAFRLTEFYFSLSVPDKADFARYSQYLSCDLQKTISCPQSCQGFFTVSNGAQFLWATAANAIPDRKYEFAERLLHQALISANDIEDIAWIHANLAQIYYDLYKSDPEAGKKSISHCQELIKIGYMKSWAKNIIEELKEYELIKS